MPSIIESIVGTPSSVPRHFWLVLDIPNTPDSFRAERDQKILTGLSHGRLEGVRGISDTKVILTDWWLMCRNAAIMMDANEVTRLNDIEQIPYGDADALVRDNMKLLARLFSKEGGSKSERFGVMQNVMQYFVRQIKLGSLKILHHTLDYYGAAFAVSDKWSTDDYEINSVRDLATYIYNTLVGVDKYKFQEVAEYDPQDFILPAREALLYCGSMYESEGEWLIHDSHFVVPQKSLMLVGVDLSILHSIEEWRQRDPDDWSMEAKKWRYERCDALLNAIKTHRLEEYYTLKFIDSNKFESIRGDLLYRRRVRREKAAQTND